ncbi:MAG: M15 family metallopeptidase [Nocardioidaceae bacterium]
MVLRSFAVALGALALTACGVSVPLSGPDPTPTATPSPTTAEPTTKSPSTTPTATTPPSTKPARPPGPTLDDWEIGASPLPLRPDGFGQVQDTPRELRDRRLPTTDLLPPPRGARFESTTQQVSSDIRRRMGESWSPDCPVGLDDLRYVTVSFWGFDGLRHTGELVVNARVVADVVGVFERLYDARYPIEEMRLVTTADLDAPPTGDGNNTAALVCRAARGQTSWSAHAYGLAIDINPFVNPYSKGDLVLPELAGAYLDRGWQRAGMVRRGDVVVDAFEAIGWTWGGEWRSLKDRMHFSATGR